MANEKYPVTPAIRALRSASISFEPHLYEYLERGGTAHSAQELSVSEHSVVKTLVLEDEHKRPLLMLMHGDREVALGVLARIIGVKKVVPCDAAAAQKHTGYLFGGTSPFGTRVALPVYVEETVLSLPLIYINGGKRGFLVSLAPTTLISLLSAKPVQAAVPKDADGNASR